MLLQRIHQQRNKFLVLVITATLVGGVSLKPKHKGNIIYAQSIPVTRTLVWDANPPSDGVLNYTVTLDGVIVGNPTGTSQPVTFSTLGNHSLAVTATNTFGTSPPGVLNVTVVIPGSPKNPHIQ